MEKEVYKATYQLEKTHWYYLSLHELVLGVIRRIANQNGRRLNILDAGCGTGGLTKSLEQFGPTVGIDISEDAVGYSRERRLSSLVEGSVTKLPFRDGSFDIVTSMDVLYHNRVEDDSVAIKEFGRVLKKDGLLIANLPAYKFLKSSHDEVVHTRRRYVRSEVGKKLREEGFDIEKLTYRNTFLFPLILFVRLLKRNTQEEKSDLVSFPDWLNSLLVAVLKVENAVLKIMNLPFGSSVFCIARKRENRLAN